MADGITATDLLTGLLGAGGLGFVAALYKGIKDYREGTWRRRDGAVADLEKWRVSSDNARKAAVSDRDWEAIQGRHWYTRAGDLEHVIRVELGPEKIPADQPFPIRDMHTGIEVTA